MKTAHTNIQLNLMFLVFQVVVIITELSLASDGIIWLLLFGEVCFYYLVSWTWKVIQVMDPTNPEQ